jgi:isocitrate lyase
MEAEGYTATRHQAEVGTGYFDRVSQVVSHGQASTLALRGSTEEEQFKAPSPNGNGHRAKAEAAEPALE